LALTGISYKRYRGACEARKSWEDPIPGLQKLRVQAAGNIHFLWREQLRDKLFTKGETEHIFVKSLERQRKVCSIQRSSANPSEMQHFLHDFFRYSNPLLTPIIDYAFPDSSIVQDPSGAVLGRWDKEFLNQLGHESEALTQVFNKLQQARRTQLAVVESKADGGHSAVNGLMTYRELSKDEKRKPNLFKDVGMRLAGHGIVHSYKEAASANIEGEYGVRVMDLSGQLSDIFLRCYAGKKKFSLDPLRSYK
jgi:hypothetical protein